MRVIYIYILILSCVALSSQNTIGVIDFDNQNYQEGYYLIYPENQSSVFLLDDCGRIVNEWQDSLSGPGKTAYFTDDGDLLKAKTSGILYDNSFGAGGAGGVVELRNWDNDLLWRYIAADSLIRQHHDVHPMPDGNVLMILWQKYGLDDIVNAGFDTSAHPQREIWADKLIEVDPSTDSIVWEWNSFDHLIQEYDPEKENYGSVFENYSRIDINYQKYSFGRSDWLHSNSIDYNEELDQIILGVRNFQELWIIDHSTTTEEASSSTGGLYNNGGDLLYRWGNPEAYMSGDSLDRQLFFQHDVQWVSQFVDPNSSYYGDILLYNNFIDQDLSLGHSLRPSWNAIDSSYVFDELTHRFLPHTFSDTFSHPDTVRGFSTAASSIQILPNENVLICAARQGRSFQIDPTGQVAWEYLTPIINGVRAPQGVVPNISTNFTFQIEFYPNDFMGFDDKDLSPGEYLELEPNEEFCLLSSLNDEVLSINNELIIKKESEVALKIISQKEQVLLFYSTMGQLIKSINISIGVTVVDIGDLAAGLYLVKGDRSHNGYKLWR